MTYEERMRRDRARRGRDMRGRGGYRGSMDFEGDYARRDGRQGVKGTGRYGRGGSMYRGDRARRDYDDDDYDMDDMDYMPKGDYRRDSAYMDYASDEAYIMTKQDMYEWKRNLHNADGSMGEHFDKAQIEAEAEKLGIRFREYDEKELCMTANMLYSDLGDALRTIIPKEKEACYYTKMAKAWLEDDDAAFEGSEKLGEYYCRIVLGE